MKHFGIIVSVLAAVLLAASCDKDDKINAPKLPSNAAAVNPAAGIPGNYVEWVQLWENGPKFASMNLGATTTAAYGDFFAWGETSPYYKAGYAQETTAQWKDGKDSGYAWDSYFDTSDGGSTFEKYKTGGKVVLDSADDAAYVIWGNKWRMPTAQELKNLLSTDYTDGGTYVTSYNGDDVEGWLFKGKAGTDYASNEVFFPASGYISGKWSYKLFSEYWSCSLSAWSSGQAACASFNTTSGLMTYGDRYVGRLIRPVLK